MQQTELAAIAQVDRRHIEPKELQAIAGAHTRAGKRQARATCINQTPA